MAIPKSTKKLILALGVLIILIIIIYYVVNRIANERLPGLLGDKAHVKNIMVDVLGRKVTFDGPTFKLDSSENAPQLSIYSNASSVVIDGFSFLDLLVSKRIQVKRLVIDSLEVDILLPNFIASDREKQEINLFIKDIFTRIEVDHFDVLNANIIVRKRDSQKKVLAIKGFRLSADQILVDTATVRKVFPLEFKKSEVHIDSLFSQPNDEYIVSGENMIIADTAFSMENIRLQPILSKAEFAAKNPYEKARFMLSVSKVTSRKLLWQVDDSGRWKVNSEKIAIDTMRLEVFKDKRPPDQPLHVKPLLAGLLRKIPLALSVDTLTLRDSYIEYEQRPVKYPRSGKVYFEKVYMTAYNIVNDSIKVKKDPTTTLDITTQFMGKGNLKVIIKLDMSSGRQGFSVSGHLGEMPLGYVNQVLAPLLGVNASGKVHAIDFGFSGDSYSSTGDMTFQYSDLHIEVFDKSREKEWLKSVFGNMVLKNKNLREDTDGHKKGEIYFVRYQNRDFFNFLWNSLRVGLMDVVVPFYKNPDLTTPPQTPKYKRED